MRLNIKALALASGFGTVIFYAVCCLLFAVSPGFMVYLFSRVAHVDLTVFTKVFDWGNFFIGLIAIFIIGYLTGALFAWLYNKFLKE